MSLSFIKTEIFSFVDYVTAVMKTKVQRSKLTFFFFNFLLRICRIFLSLMETAELTDLLRQEGSYTAFAPTDDAFSSLSREDMALLKSESSRC